MGVVRKAKVTSKGQVTIPADIRRLLGIDGGGPVTFREEGGRVLIQPAHKPSLRELVDGFDPERHRHGPQERPWDDAPRGRETL
ncbi:AbrB/MazE/SpoVT family DNA-binding domain-containing protein [Azospirillum sp.]|uniref:AbrB/MazE/SpoVT family DNA-binding domain-containing protein n=1 Tax=Azospirillum sp. TaxID=34012 RepID=UPI002D5F6B34|nr:AbrB/MazE/SpoVT family DNA-binding domain-containing protein [Azospirillum sp.]HYD67288.1 AbrB/MazE/SpoVT family DNA-binding domain-containing protein [Azospirillum sp.]